MTNGQKKKQNRIVEEREARVAENERNDKIARDNSAKKYAAANDAAAQFNSETKDVFYQKHSTADLAAAHAAKAQTSAYVNTADAAKRARDNLLLGMNGRDGLTATAYVSPEEQKRQRDNLNAYNMYLRRLRSMGADVGSDELSSAVRSALDTRAKYGSQEEWDRYVRQTGIDAYFDQFGDVDIPATQATANDMNALREKYADAVSQYDRMFSDLVARGHNPDEAKQIATNAVPAYGEYQRQLSALGYGGQGEFEQTRSATNRTLTLAQRYQEMKRMQAEAEGAADFAEVSRRGLAVWDAENAQNEADSNSFWGQFSNTLSQLVNGGRNPQAQDYGYYSEEERAVLAYYMAKENAGEVPAGTTASYAASLREIYNTRGGAEMAAQLDDSRAAEYLFGISAGLDQFKSGITDFVGMLGGADYHAPSQTQIASGYVREDLADAGFKIGDTSIGQVAYDMITTTANMLPSIAASTVAGALGAPQVAAGAIGSSVLGASAAGNAYQEMLRDGYSKGQSAVYATITGFSEAALQYALDGVQQLGSGALQKLMGKGFDQFAKAFATSTKKAAIVYGAKAVAKGASQVFGEGLEEFLQDLFEPFVKSFATGEAVEDIDWSKAFYSFCLGALSAGILDAPANIKNIAQVNSTIRTALKNGDVQTLIDLGLSFADETAARQIAELYNGSDLTDPSRTDKANLRHLYMDALQNMDAQTQTDVENALRERGVDEALIPEAAQNLMRQQRSGGYSSAFAETVDATPGLAEAMGDVEAQLRDSDGATNRRFATVSKLAGQNETFGKEGYLAKYRKSMEADRSESSQNALTRKTASITARMNNGAQNVNEALLRQGIPTARTKNDASIARVQKQIASDRRANPMQYSPSSFTRENVQTDSQNAPVRFASGENNALTVVMGDGTSAAIRNAVFQNDAQAAVYGTLADGIEDGTISVNTANAILNAVDFDAPNPSMQAARMAMIASHTGSGVDIAPEFMASYRGDVLTRRQASFAEKLGKDNYTATRKAAQDYALEDTEAKPAEPAKRETKRAEGDRISREDAAWEQKMRGRGVIISAPRSTLTNRQLYSVEAVGRVCADVTGGKVIFFESVVDPKTGARVFSADVEGTKYKAGDTAPNGEYMMRDGTILLDLNAGDYGTGTILYTFAHELTHFVRDWSKARYAALEQFVLDEYKRGDVNVDELIEAQIEKAAAQGEELDRDGAMEEVIADAMQEMFTAGDVLERMERLKNKDRTLWERIRDKISELSQKIKEVYKRLSPDSAEAKKLRQIGADIDKLAKMFAESVVEAGENFQKQVAEEVVGERDIDGEPTEHTYSLRSLAVGLGYNILFNEDGGIETDGHGIVIVDQNGKRVTRPTMDVIMASPLGRLVEASDITPAEKTAQYNMLRDLLGMAMRYQDLSLPWEAVGSVVFGAVKSNSDPQYKRTVDFTTICKKTADIINVISKTSLKLGRGLSTTEVRRIVYEEVGRAGMPTPCPVCYVFSHWMGLGGILDNMYNFQMRTNEWTEAKVKSFVSDLQKAADAFKISNPEKYKGDNKNPTYSSLISDMITAGDKARVKLEKQLNEHYSKVDEIQRLQERLKKAEGEDAETIRESISNLQAELLYDSQIDSIEAEMQRLYKTPTDGVGVSVEDLQLYKFLLSSRYTGSKKKKYDKSYKPYENLDRMKNAIFDMNQAEVLVTEFPQLWRYRNSRGNGAGKALLPYSEAIPGEVMQGLSNDIAVGEDQRISKNKWMYGTPAEAARMLRDQRQKLRAQNLIGGFRYQSTSDFRFQFGSDYLMTFLEMQALNANVQLYTKVIEAVDFLASTGADVNLSGMPNNNGYYVDKNGNIVLDFSDVTGINAEAAIAMTEKYDNVQFMTVGINDMHIVAALGSKYVSFVIPFHGSGNSVTAIQEMMERLGQTLDVTTASDYTQLQTDKKIPKDEDPLYEKHEAARNARLKLIQGKDLSKADMEAIRGNKYLSDLYRRFREDKNAAEYGVKFTKDQAGQIFPYEYWDKTSTYETADVNGRRFVEYCESLGMYPRFSGSHGDNVQENYGDFTNVPGYWKLLIDRRMYDRNGNYREQQRINVTGLDLDYLSPEWAKEKYGDVMQKDSTPLGEIHDRVANKVVERINERRSMTRDAAENAPGSKKSLRNQDPTSARAVLSSALESAAKTDAERRLLARYQDMAIDLDVWQSVVANLRREIHALSFADGPRDTERITAMRNEVDRLVKQISVADKTLLNLEASAPLKRLLENETARVRKIEREKGRAALIAEQTSQRERRERELDAMREQSNARIEDLRRQKDEKYERDMQALRDRKDAQIERIRQKRDEKLRAEIDKRIEMRQKDRDTRASRDLREKITKLRDEMSTRLAEGSGKTAIPLQFVDGLISVCDALDPTPKRLMVLIQNADGTPKINKNGRNIYRPARDNEFTPLQIDEGLANGTLRYSGQEQRDRIATRNEALRRLRDVYDSLSAEENDDLQAAFDKEFSDDIRELVSSFKEDKQIRDMSRAELEDVYTLMRRIWTRIRDAKRLIGENERATADQSRTRVSGEMQRMEKVKIGKSKVQTFARNTFSNPIRMVREMTGYRADSEMNRLFTEIRNGWMKGEIFKMNAGKKMDEVRTTKADKKALRDAGKGTVEMTDSDGNKFNASLLQVMQYLLTYERTISNPNAEHLQYGSYFSDIDLLRKGKRDEANAKAHHIDAPNEQLLNRLYKLVNDNAWAVRFMENARYVLQQMSTEEINATSMILEGVPIARDNAYIPYRVMPEWVDRGTTNDKTQASVRNIGFTKRLIPSAKTPLLFEGLDLILQQHVDEVAKYVGLAVPIRNWNTVMYYGQRNDGIPVSKRVTDAWGTKSWTALKQAVADIQGRRQNNVPAWVSKIRSAWVFATLASNVSVTIKQAASYPTAGAYLSLGALRHGVNAYLAHPKSHRAIYDRMDALTAEGYMRRRGWTTQEFGDMPNGIQKVFNAVDRKLGQFSPFNWIQSVDVNTTTALFLACEYEIEHVKGIKKDDPRYRTALKNLYETVIENTQPMYDPVHQTEVSRSPFWNKFIVFQTQPLQNSGILRDATQQMRFMREMYGKDSAPYKTAKKQFGSALSSQIMTSIVFVAMTMAAKLLRHKPKDYEDDEGKLTAASIFSQLGVDAGMNLFSAIFPVVGNYATQIAQWVVNGRGDALLSDPTLDAVNEALDAFVNEFTNARKAITGDAEYDLNKLKKFLVQMASFAGIPLGNAWNLAEGVALHVQDAVNGQFGSFEAGSTQTSAQADKALYDAILAGDKDKVDKAFKESKSADDWHTKLRQVLRDNDPRVAQMVQAYFQKDYKTQKKLRNAIKADGKFIFEDIRKAELSEQTYLGNQIEKAQEAYAAGDERTYEKTMAALEERGYDRAFLDELFGDVEFASETGPWWENGDDETTPDAQVSQYRESDVAAIVLDGTASDRKMMFDDLVAYNMAKGDSHEDAVETTQSTFRSAALALYKDRQYTISQVEQVYEKYGGYSGDDLYWEIEKIKGKWSWDADGNPVQNTYSMYDPLTKAYSSGSDIKTLLDNYTSHGKKASSVASAITERFKPLWVAAYKSGDKQEQARLLAFLKQAYTHLGYEWSDRYKKIMSTKKNGWLYAGD